jgi:hypothetical protein
MGSPLGDRYRDSPHPVTAEVLVCFFLEYRVSFHTKKQNKKSSITKIYRFFERKKKMTKFQIYRQISFDSLKM